jgi:hypothetical protein
VPPALRDASGTFTEVVALAVAASNAQLRVREALRGLRVQHGSQRDLHHLAVARPPEGHLPR